MSINTTANNLDPENFKKQLEKIRREIKDATITLCGAYAKTIDISEGSLWLDQFKAMQQTELYSEPNYKIEKSRIAGIDIITKKHLPENIAVMRDQNGNVFKILLLTSDKVYVMDPKAAGIDNYINNIY